MIAKVLAVTSALSIVPCAANLMPVPHAESAFVQDTTRAAPDPARLADAISSLQENARLLSDPGACATTLRCGVTIIQYAAIGTAVGPAALSTGIGLVYLNDLLWRNSSLFVLHNTGVYLFWGGAYTMGGSALVGAAGAAMVGSTAFAPTPAHAAELEDGLLGAPETLSRLLEREPSYIQRLAEAHPRLGHALIAIASAVRVAGHKRSIDLNSLNDHRNHRR